MQEQYPLSEPEGLTTGVSLWGSKTSCLRMTELPQGVGNKPPYSTFTFQNKAPQAYDK